MMDQANAKSEKKQLVLLRTLIAVIFTGVGFGFVMAFVSNGFVLGVEWLSVLRASASFLVLNLGDLSLSFGPLVSLLIAACAILVVRRLFGIVRWHGPADSIYAAHRTDNELDVKQGFGSTLAAFISASGGASVGQYGPLVHFGATMGSFIRQITGSKITTDVFIGCGVAGAIAAGFNAPIAGVVFAHEAILRHFSLRAIAPIAIASITAAWVSKWVFGSNPLFMLGDLKPNLIELLPAALIAGPVFGLMAVLFMQSLRRSAAFAVRSRWSPARLLFTAALLTGCIGMFVPEVLGLGGGTVAAVLGGGYDEIYLLLLLILKLGVTSLCIGFGMFGGVFSPAMFVGVTAGAVVGRLLALLGLSVAGPGLAICGMASVAAAVIGAPVAGVLIILEMTMSYEFALAAMLSVVVCTMVSNVIFGHSFFDRQLLDRKIDVSQGRGHIEMMETPVMDVVSPDYVRLADDVSVTSAIAALVAAEATEGYVLAGDNDRFIGKVALHELLGADGSTPAGQHLMQEPISIKHDASLQQAIEVASNFVGESIPIINRDSGVFQGVVTEADLFKLYLTLQSKVTDLERS
jgi:CIC family chloride channel protein